MIMNEEEKDKVLKLFKVVYTYKDDAKQASSSATETINTIADFLDKEKSKKSQASMKKAVRKAFKEWVDRTNGDKSSDDAQIILANLIL